MGVIDYITRRRVKALEDRWQVFEVRNLDIQAGTDWSTTGHALGTFSPGESWGNSVLYKLWVELAAPATSELRLTVDDGPDWSTAGTLMSARVAVGQRWWALPAEELPADLLLGAGVTNPINGVAATVALPPLPETLYVGLHTLAPTDEDMTIVRARAAFLIV